MSLQTDLAAAVAQTQGNAAKFNQFINGPAAGDGSLIATEAGPVKSLARITAEAAAAAAAGVVPFTALVAWATGLNCVVGPPATAVTFGGETYVCNTPHVAGATFAADAAKWTKLAAKGIDGVDGIDGTNGTNGTEWPTPPIINGCMRVAQRASTALSTTATYGQVDRLACWASGGAVSAGNITQISNSGIGRTGYALRLAGVTLTGAGQLSVRYRMESLEARKFKGLTGSFGLRCSHDTGASINYELHVRKPTAADNFAAVTAIANGATAVASGIGAATLVKLENVALGDVSNGLEIEIKVPCGAIAAKNFDFAELQMSVGTTLQPFNYYEDITQTLHRCMRYYEVGASSLSSSYVPSVGWGMYCHGSFRANKRTTPSVSASFGAIWAVTTYAVYLSAGVSSAPEGYAITFYANAEL